MAKILVIDDEATVRKLLTALFEKEGYEVKNGYDGNNGLSIAREFEPDLIITDLLMPEKEGLETIKEIKQMNADIKIIAISGGGIIQPELYLKLAEQGGADMSFTKPVDIDLLLTAVKQLLEE